MLIYTLDAGGTNFVFVKIKNGKIYGEKIHKPANGDNLDICLSNIIQGFKELSFDTNEKPDAISFAFPGPADFANGIIGDLYNLPAFRGGIALGKMLEEQFNVPVFINNDGDLYTYGEALVGTLPYINAELKKNNSIKKYKNIVGFTLGSGFGAGIVSDNNLIMGDNMSAAEIWVCSNRVNQKHNCEEGISIRALKYYYSQNAKVDFNLAPSPKEMYDIGKGKIKGNKEVAIDAFYKMGQYLGDAIANMITLLDGIVVIGGGLAGAKELIIPGIQYELNHKFDKINGGQNPRLTHKVFCLNDDKQLNEFVKNHSVQIKVPYSDTIIMYDNEPRAAYCFSNFDTSEMISLGAYYYAVQKLSK